MNVTIDFEDDIINHDLENKVETNKRTNKVINVFKVTQTRLSKLVYISANLMN